MKIEEYLELIHLAENLKNNTRHSWTSNGHRETVAEHSWRLALMAFFIRDEYPEADGDKLIMMCLLHDMGEAFTGDIPAFKKTGTHDTIERNRINEWIANLPLPYQHEVADLFDEMEKRETLEAKVFKALDNIEAVIQHNEADISTWLPLEYDLQMTYGVENTKFSKYMSLFRKQVQQETAEKIDRVK